MERDLAVVRGLAANPGTPPEVLLRLATDHPEPEVALALLGRDELPRPVARALAGHPHVEIRRHLVNGPATPDDVRHGLAHDADPTVRAELAAWPPSWLSFPGNQAAAPLPVEVCRQLAADGVFSVRAALGHNRFLPEAVRVTLAGDPDPVVRRCAAARTLPAAVLHRLLGDGDHEVRTAALRAATLQVPPATIPEHLADSFLDGPEPQRAARLAELTPALLERLWSRPALRPWLAGNPSLPTERMRALLDDADLRPWLANNPRLPASVLEELATTGDLEVGCVLASRLDLPDRLLRGLPYGDDDPIPIPSLLPEHAGLALRLSYLDHPNVAIRRTLALAHDLPAHAVERLANDPDLTVRLFVCEHYTDVPPAVVAEVIERRRGHVPLQLFAHPRLPAAAVSRYAGSDKPTERAAIAGRPDLPPVLAARLVTDPDPAVRRAAAANPNLPAERIRELLTDPDRWLREGAAANPALPVEEMRRLALLTWQA